MTEAFTTLHLIFNIDSYNKATTLISGHDKVLLLQDAAYLASKTTDSNAFTYARLADVKARNIQVANGVEVIDDEQWLALTQQAKNIMSW